MNTNDLHPCPCCGSKVLTQRGEYEICNICGWEDDPIQSNAPNFAGGANKLSLSEAKKAWSGRQGQS